MSFIDDNWKFHSSTIAWRKIDGRHTRERLSNFLLSVDLEYKIENNVGFVTTDGASSAKRQINLTAAEEEILLDIMYDPSFYGNNELDSADLSAEMDKGTLVLSNCITDTSYPGSEGETDSSSLAGPTDATGEANDGIEHLGSPVVDSFVCYSNSHITHFQSNGCSNISYELPNPSILSEMLDCSEFESAPSLTLYSARASWNQIICTAHHLQLSVRKVLDLPEIRPVLSMIRQTVKLFRRSSIAATYLKNVLKNPSNSKKHSASFLM